MRLVEPEDSAGMMQKKHVIAVGANAKAGEQFALDAKKAVQPRVGVGVIGIGLGLHPYLVFFFLLNLRDFGS